MFTQRSRDAITVTWKTRHFRHFTSEHYKLSKREVVEKVILADYKLSKREVVEKVILAADF